MTDLPRAMGQPVVCDYGISWFYTLPFVLVCVTSYYTNTSKEEGKDRESIQSNITPEPGHYIEK